MTFCLIHNCLLENYCRRCNSTIAPYRLKWDSSLRNCYKSEANLSKTEIKKISNKDPILKSSKRFFQNPELNNHEILKVLSLAWNLGRYYLSHKIFQKHPLSRDEELIKLWENIRDKRPFYNSTKFFSNIKASYFLIGTATRLRKKTQKFYI